ncbi:uncharacterized protein Z519_10006 [Cladophialophora bantiana CBS 173.52]|uniref:Uncharacterized protein n=1 Tax=Cladophialophora bantiana (strain ATCC 10958 / CBS 173.52 / CDC B-1940 / NIH 8579) TaxID=1442370 RepID=A0A0D2HX48_CLAB1|nr:uncharacterized protein Z519_10006 [Cladophialophora bantiana CBS 173.52]KIW89154.1 hypothetical protein Z519_10006 [Cladophialophora bantiana CBS 173.52]
METTVNGMQPKKIESLADHASNLTDEMLTENKQQIQEMLAVLYSMIQSQKQTMAKALQDTMAYSTTSRTEPKKQLRYRNVMNWWKERDLTCLSAHGSQNLGAWRASPSGNGSPPSAAIFGGFQSQGSLLQRADARLRAQSETSTVEQQRESLTDPTSNFSSYVRSAISTLPEGRKRKLKIQADLTSEGLSFDSGLNSESGYDDDSDCGLLMGPVAGASWRATIVPLSSASLGNYGVDVGSWSKFPRPDISAAARL